MKHLAPSLLLLLVACTGETEPSEPGNLLISYIWEGFDSYPENCGGAWAESVWVEIESEVEYSDLAFPCDNQPIAVERVNPGDWTVILRTVQDIETADRGWNLSDPVSFSLASAESLDLEIALVCYDDGVEDRCSGL